MKTTIDGTKIKSTSSERESEIVNIINTFDLLGQAVRNILDSPEYTTDEFQAAYNAQWSYYNDHIDIIAKAHDPI